MSNQKKDLISIVVPIFKVETLLDRCVKSLLCQTYSTIEIILVDDGSPDRSPEMCDEYARSDSRVRVIHKKNGGLSDARNAGLLIAEGEFVLYVDSDDFIEEDACERLIQGFSEETDFVVGGCKEIRGEKEMLHKYSCVLSGIEYSAKDFATRIIKSGEFYAPAWLQMYRRSFLMENSLFYKVGYLYEDVQMIPRLFLAAKKITYIDYPFYNYVIRENSIMTTAKSDFQREMSLKVYEEWFSLLQKITDNEYKKTWNGFLVKCFLANARVRNVKKWSIKGLDIQFAMENALNIKERVKIIVYHFFPSLYLK